MGPLSPPALGGFRYVSNFSDQLTTWNEVFLLKEKNSAVDTVQLYNQAVVIPSGLRLERLRADKAGENTGAAFRKYCLDVGIKSEFASTNTPQQIGANERLGRTLAGTVRCLLSDSGLPPFLWGELFLTASYLSNRAPHAALGNKTPFQALGKPAPLGHLRAVGAQAFVHTETFTKKLDARAWEGRLVGYSTDSTSFRVYHPETRKVRESQNVVFIETPSVAPEPDLMLDERALEYHEPDDLVRDVRNYAIRLGLGSSCDNRTSNDVSVRQLLGQLRGVTGRDLRVTPARTETPETPSVEQPSLPGTQSSSGRETPPVGGDSPVSSQASNPSVPNTRTLRKLRKLAFFAKGEFPDVGHRDGMHRFAEFAYAASYTQLHSYSPQGTVTVPERYQQAMKLQEAELWKEEAQKEIKSLQDLKVYTLVPKSNVPKGQNVIGLKWVFKVKTDNTYKARLVAQGWNQVHGRDCGGTYAPVCRLQNIWMVLAIAAELNLEERQVDAKTAFLYADIEEEVCVKTAPGFETINKDGVQLVMKLGKSLYRLAQSPQNWWKTIDPKLIEIGFVPLKSDSCVYIYNHNNTVVIVTLYVDDLLVIGSNVRVIETIKKKLKDNFQMSDLGDVSLVLGMQVTRGRKKGTLTISQEDDTKSILARFGMENCKPSSIPGTGSELSTEQPAETLLNMEQTQRYQAITGSVMYLAQITRCDVMYTVCQLARAISKPSKTHMGAAKQLLRYLAGTTDFSIVYKRGGFKLSAFSDANWGNNPDNGKSTSPYLVMLSKAPISFKSRIQSLTAVSTMEAELVASALTMKEAVFCSNMMRTAELVIPPQERRRPGRG